MPATDQIWRPLPNMHRWFAGSMVLLTIATWLMVRKDENLEWRDYQRQAGALREDLLVTQLQKYNDAAFQARLASAAEQIAAADRAVNEHGAALSELDAQIQSKTGESNLAERRSKFQNAVRDKARADLDLAVRDNLPPARLAELQAEFNLQQASAEQLLIEVQQVKAELDALKSQRAAATSQRDEAVSEQKRLLADRQQLYDQLALLAPDSPHLPPEMRSPFRAAKRAAKEWPILNAFNPHLKIQYDWPSLEGERLKIQLGMARVDRVDRCRTCHVNINEFSGQTPTFPHGDREAGKYPHPFASHPNPELYLTSLSPHPIENFGCTICHLGDGSGTSFQNAEHTPSNPAQAEHWAHDHHWHSNHFWEQPMLPNTFVEASCLRCHHSVVELGVNAKFGASAPKLFEGYELIKEYGCFGCHPINGYDGTRPIGPDLRLEPQTAAEALAIASDPNQIAGRERKVGPSLRHVAQKVDKDFLTFWTEEPKRFRPDTRMPQFFHLDNQEDHLAELLQPVELVGVAAYLQARSEPLTLQRPREGYQADAARGKVLFSQRGCLACHTHNDEDFTGIRQDFGPNLTRIHEKIKGGEEGFAWLYTWLKQPTLHHPRTRMPNLYLEPEEKPDSYVDPAADIAAFLLQGGPTDFPEMPLPGVYLGVVTAEATEGVRVTEVLLHSPAIRAVNADAGGSVVPGLLADDVILSINGQPVKTPAELDALVGRLASGAPIDLLVARGGRTAAWKTSASTPLEDLVRLFLSKSLPEAEVARVFETRKFPVSPLAWKPRPDGSLPSLAEFVKGDEIELAPRSADEEVSDADWAERQMLYIGRRTISRYGCYGCHDIPGFEDGRPIGTALQDWGRKDTSQLALEHIEEFLHHHGEPDGSSTTRAVADIISREYNDGSQSHTQKTKALFYESLLHHGRPGFLWQKLRAPRSYDYMKTQTKGWDERLRMPKFPFQEEQIESVATFVLGLVADPAPEPYLFKPDGPAGAIIEGERLLAKFNCAGCHILEMPGFQYNVDLREFVGLTRDEIVDLLTRRADDLIAGRLTQGMLAGRDPIPDELWAEWLQKTPEPQREAVKEAESALLAGVAEFIINCETLLEDRLPDVGDLTKDVAPLLGRLARSRNAQALQNWLDAHPETLIADNIGVGDYADAVRLNMQLKPPVHRGETITSSTGRRTIQFHGLQYSSDPDFGEDTYDLWENLEVGGRFKLAGINSRFIANEDNPVTGRIAGRGGEFMQWLFHRLALEKAGGEAALMPQFIYGAQQSSPPPLYREGVKVQTPWLFSFLKNPDQLRFTTVLRMPQFNLSDDEARALANYFAAVDGVPFPYQDVTRRDPAYLAAMQQAHEAAFADASDDYLTQSWKLINANQCIKCHSIGGRRYQASGELNPDGTPKDIRGPNLQRVQDRLRPDWTQLWVYNPKWITPYTSMPANLPRDQRNFPELFGADGHWQNPAVVDALMNYAALLERLGVVVYNPTPDAPADGAAPPATDGSAAPPEGNP